MTILTVLLCIIAFVLLITWGKVNAFLAFLVISIATGLLLGVPFNKITGSVQKGIGDMVGSLLVIIALGAMLGKLVSESGAAQKISSTLVNAFGKKNIQWALMLTGFIAGLPLFYNVGFVLLIPLLFSVAYQYKLPVVYTGLPMLAALSVTHGFLPPHPSPTALVGQFNASMGLTLLYGLAIAIPVILIAGPLFSKTLKNLQATPLQTFQSKPLPEDQLPGAFNSFITSLLPVILLIITTVYLFVENPMGEAGSVAAFFSDATIIMIISLAVATWSLGLRNGRRMQEIMGWFAEAVKDVSLILLIVAGAGALKQVFVDSGVSNDIAAMLQTSSMHPLVLGWLIAAVIRVCVGSATVAGLTAAGIIAPVMKHTDTDPNLMVLSIGAGSLMFSHVNDAGFWMFKEYFNLGIKDTFRSWSLMETIISIAGLGGVLLLNMFV
ncbi:MAG TPA: gluconate:H+ symporter [Chitinophagaceae bacterium]|nr:gluconate:H+ symporter [Chitinophagaceae bacterium]